jgi:hypothetical protein
MRILVYAVVLAPALLVSALAQAKPSPPEPQRASLSLEETSIDSGTSGAMLESDYFNAPHGPFTPGRLTPCRLQVNMFAKTRIATQIARLCN